MPLQTMRILLVVLHLTWLGPGCQQYREDLDYEYPVEYSWSEPEVSGQLSLFQGVHWEPAYARAVRPLLTDQSLVANRRVLDISCGPGAIAVLCASEGAKSVLSLAESKAAEACARYNAAASAKDTVVTVQLAATSLPLGQASKFDIIFVTLSNGYEETQSPQIDFALNCLYNHLELSGRAFAICEDGKLAVALKAKCDPLAIRTRDVGNKQDSVSVVEMIRSSP